MKPPKVLLCYVHRPMTAGLMFYYAARQAGCEVRTAGPGYNEVYGIEGWDDYRAPDFMLQTPSSTNDLQNNVPMNVQMVVEHVRAQGFNPDLVLMIDQYDFFYLTGEGDGSYKTAWVAVENYNPEQAQRATQRKFDETWYMIAHHSGLPPGQRNPDPPEGAEWLPFGFDPFIHPFLGRVRDKAVCQIGSPYEPRPSVWNAIRSALDGAPNLGVGEYTKQVQESPSTLFGRAPSYNEMAEVYNRSIVTLSASNCDFSPMRTFEALAMGCILVSDDVPVIRALLGPPRSEEMPGLWISSGDGMREGVGRHGNIDGVIEAVRTALSMSEDERRGMVIAGIAHAYTGHTYAHRMRRILEKVGLTGVCRMV